MWKERRDSDSSYVFAALADNLAVSAMVFLLLFFVLVGVIDTTPFDQQRAKEKHADVGELSIEIKLDHGVEILSGNAINLPFRFQTTRATLPTKEEIAADPKAYTGYTSRESAQTYLQEEILPKLMNNPDIAYVEIQGHADGNPTCEQIKMQKTVPLAEVQQAEHLLQQCVVNSGGDSGQCQVLSEARAGLVSDLELEQSYQRCIQCKSTGQYCSNWMISAQRAAYVLELMLQRGKQSVDKNQHTHRFVVTAHSSNQPIEGKRKKATANRRVQIVAYGKDGNPFKFKQQGFKHQDFKHPNFKQQSQI